MVGLALAGAVAVSACGSSNSAGSTSGIPRDLLLEARPIGRGPRFHPPARGPVIGACRARLGPRDGVHVELFAANRVVIVPAGIGVRGPLTTSAGRITRSRTANPDRSTARIVLSGTSGDGATATAS